MNIKIKWVDGNISWYNDFNLEMVCFGNATLENNCSKLSCHYFPEVHQFIQLEKPRREINFMENMATVVINPMQNIYTMQLE